MSDTEHSASPSVGEGNDYNIDLSDYGVPREEGESWQEVVDRRQDDRDVSPPFACVCGAEYTGRRAALLCCSDRFHDQIESPDDLDLNIDQSCNVRETVRVPQWMRDVMDQLVDTGEVTNRSEIHRQALAFFLEVSQRE